MRAVEWDVIPSSPHPAHMHMALDEVLLERVIAGQRRPTLRFWEHIEPALVIGSHQSVTNEVDVIAARELGFAVTRRMSGGGTMLAEPERTITYSLYLPDSIVSGITFRKSYALLDDWAVRAFVELGIPSELSGDQRHHLAPGQDRRRRAGAPAGVRPAPHDHRPFDGCRAAAAPDQGRAPIDRASRRAKRQQVGVAALLVHLTFVR